MTTFSRFAATFGAAAIVAAPLAALVSPAVSSADGPCAPGSFWNTITNSCQYCPAPNMYWEAATNQCINVPNPLAGPAGPIGVGPNPVVGPAGPVGVGANPVVGPVGPAGVGAGWGRSGPWARGGSRPHPA